MESAQDIVDALRGAGMESTRVEVKAAAGGFPTSVRDSVSALRNGTGGTILLGIDESAGFDPVKGLRLASLRDALVGVCANDITPPVPADVVVEEVDGVPILRLDVDEADPSEKPCYVTTKGRYGGSFIRAGDGDRRLTEYEVSQLLSNRTQPVEDRAPVAGARRDHLDAAEVRRFVDRARERQPRAFGSAENDEILEMTGVLVQHDGELVPSLAGLLCLGRYPQQFHPQLNVTFVVWPTAERGQAEDGTRFVDNRSFDGALPLIIGEAVNVIVAAVGQASVVTGVGRYDRPGYPVEVVREAVTNALMHRDYSAGARGTQVQVELFPDRLVVRSPGGLYGEVDPAEFGRAGVSSSRNAVLARLLAEVPMPGTGGVVCENRGSGIPRMLVLLRAAGMSPPAFDVSPGHVSVTVHRRALLDQDTLEWLASIDAPGLGEDQRLALAIMREAGTVSNENLRGWGIDRLDATHALTGLVQLGLAHKEGGRRYAAYVLSGRARPDSESALPSELRQVLDLVPLHGAVTTRQVGSDLGLDYQAALRRINRLIELGRLVPTAAKSSRRRAYRRAR